MKRKILSIPSVLLSFILVAPSCVESDPSGDAGGGAGGAPANSGGSGVGGNSSGGAGTGGAGSSSGGAGTGGDDGAETCRGLDEAACIAESICRPAYGYRPGPGNPYGGDFGDDNLSYQGCRFGGPPENETYCGDAYTCGYDPEDGTECWAFANTCVPLGWVSVSCFVACPLGAGGAGGAGN